MTRFLMTAFLAAGLLCAQEPAAPKPAPNSEAAIIPVKTLTGDSFNRLVRMLRVFDVPLQADDQLRTILVYAPPDVLAKVRKVIEELDQPGSQAAIGRNIEMTLSFLKCPPQPTAGAPALPSELQSVAREIERATQCANVELWDMVPMRIQEGKRAEQALTLPGGESAQITLDVSSVGAKEGRGRYVRFERINIGLRGQDQTNGQFHNEGLNTAGDLLENQKTVLGKMSGRAAGAVFVVVTLHILD